MHVYRTSSSTFQKKKYQRQVWGHFYFCYYTSTSTSTTSTIINSGKVFAMDDPLVSAVDHDTVEQIKFVAYSVVAYVIVAIGMLGNVLSLVVLTRPNLKVGIRLLSKETDFCPGCDVCVPVGLGRVQPVRSDHCSPCPL